MKSYHRNSLRTNICFDRDSRYLITRIASLSERLVDLPVNLDEGRKTLSPLFQQTLSLQKNSKERTWSEEAMQFRVHDLINAYLMERSV
jgi:hypothetical protein